MTDCERFVAVVLLRHRSRHPGGAHSLRASDPGWFGWLPPASSWAFVDARPKGTVQPAGSVSQGLASSAWRLPGGFP